MNSLVHLACNLERLNSVIDEGKVLNRDRHILSEELNRSQACTISVV